MGSIGLALQAADSRAALDAYVQLHVREEMRLEALVRNLPAFLRFLARERHHPKLLDSSA